MTATEAELLRVGSLKTGLPLARNCDSLVEDTTRVMLRIKALFRARAIRTPGRSIYSKGNATSGSTSLTRPEHGCAPRHCSRSSTCSSSCDQRRRRR